MSSSVTANVRSDPGFKTEPGLTSSSIASDSKDGDDGSPNSLRPLVPSSPAEWEARKNAIEELYLNKNLVLNDVIDIMLSAHSFKAT